MASTPNTFYNTTSFAVNPREETYKHEVISITHIDPNETPYDYTLEIDADINKVIENFKYQRFLGNANEHEGVDEALAWKRLHNLLNTGDDQNGTVSQTVVTTMSDGDQVFGGIDSTSDNTWLTFWAGIISEAIDKDDKDGLSVKREELVNALNDCNGGPPQETQTEGVVVNDILGTLNVSMNSSFNRRPVQEPPRARENYFAALAIALYHRFGSGEALSGDPSDGPVSVRLREGDAIGLRFNVIVVNIKTGLIKIRQKAQVTEE